MKEALAINGFGQTEILLQRLECDFPGDFRMTEISRLSKAASSASKAGDLESALKLESAALSICLEMRDNIDIRAFRALAAAKFYNLGQLHYRLKHFSEATKCFKEAGGLDEAAGNLTALAANLRGMAFIEQDTRMLTAAIELHKRALDLDVRAAFEYGIAIDQANLGENYRTLRMFDLARSHLNRAIESFQGLGRTKEVKQLQDLLAKVADQT